MNSIGSHFFALAPAEQAHRIVHFSEALWNADPLPTLKAAGSAIRLALRSMADGRSFPGVVRVRAQFILIETPWYCISTAPEGTFIVES